MVAHRATTYARPWPRASPVDAALAAAQRGEVGGGEHDRVGLRRRGAPASERSCTSADPGTPRSARRAASSPGSRNTTTRASPLRRSVVNGVPCRGTSTRRRASGPRRARCGRRGPAGGGRRRRAPAGSSSRNSGHSVRCSTRSASRQAATVGVDVAQGREPLAALSMPCGSCTDTGAGEVQLPGHPQRGGVADVVAVGLEGRAEHGDPGAGEVPSISRAGLTTRSRRCG